MVISHDRWFLDRLCHPHPGLRGRQPRRMVRGQLRGLRGRQEAPPGRRQPDPPPHQVPEVHAVGADARGRRASSVRGQWPVRQWAASPRPRCRAVHQQPVTPADAGRPWRCGAAAFRSCPALDAEPAAGMTAGGGRVAVGAAVVAPASPSAAALALWDWRRRWRSGGGRAGMPAARRGVAEALARRPARRPRRPRATRLGRPLPRVRLSGRLSAGRTGIGCDWSWRPWARGRAGGAASAAPATRVRAATEATSIEGLHGWVSLLGPDGATESQTVEAGVGCAPWSNWYIMAAGRERRRPRFALDIKT